MPTPSWTSSGATQAGANTDWTLASTYNGYGYFTGASGWFLWSASAITPFYVISETLGSSSPGHYESATPPAALPDNPWTGEGSFTFDTAPTVTAYSGGGSVYPLSGTLLDNHGSPLAGANVQFTAAGQTTVNVTSGSGGDYSSRNLAAGIDLTS